MESTPSSSMEEKKIEQNVIRDERGIRLLNIERFVFKVPEIFVESGQTAEYMSDLITANSYIWCAGAQINNLSCFYLNPVEHWEILNQLMEHLQKAFDTFLPRPPEYIPDPLRLVVGLYINVKIEAEHTVAHKKEVNRGQLIEIVERHGRTMYKIFLIDYGDIVVVPIDDLLYMSQNCLKVLPAQAIACEAILPTPYATLVNRSPNMQRMEAEMLRTIIFQQKLAVNFIETSVEKTQGFGGKKWVVSIDIAPGEDSASVPKKQVEQIVIRNLQGGYIHH